MPARARKRSIAPASPATIPAPTRNDGSLTSSASRSGSATAENTQTMRAPIAPPVTANSTVSRRVRPARGTAKAARIGLSASTSTRAHSSSEGASSSASDELVALAWTIGIVRRSGERVLLVVHPRSAVDKPGALDPFRPVVVRSLPGVVLLLQGESRHAACALRCRLAHARQPGIRNGCQPPARQRFAHHSVAAAARRVTSSHELPPGPELLGDPAHSHAHEAGRAARVVDLVLGERVVTRALGELRCLGRAVGGPVVGDGRPVTLDVVARLGEVAAECGPRLRPSPRLERPGEGEPGPSRPRPCSTSNTRRGPALHGRGRTRENGARGLRLSERKFPRRRSRGS